MKGDVRLYSISIIGVQSLYICVSEDSHFFAYREKYGPVLLRMGLVSIFCYIRHASHLTFIR